MSIKPRSPDQTAISVSMSASLLKDIDARAQSLGLNRSQYLSQLARSDLMSGGDLILRDTFSPTLDTPQTPPVPPHQTETSYHKRKRKK